MSKDNYDYDAVIIGAGISGLVCGCYLAKAGLKTLIVEKNPKVGGYCTSFTRNGYHFDAFAHSLGGCSEKGNITEILKELNIKNRINLKRYDPSDTIITPDYKISYYSDLNKTINEFQECFPRESKNVKYFFNYLVQSNYRTLTALRSKTFNDILNQYFNDEKLKAILSFPILGNTGLPSSLISAFSAQKLYTEFIIDGGYYPIGGMQVLPNILAEKFKEMGGILLLHTRAKKINVRDNKVTGVILENNNFISSKYIVSSVDAVYTFFNLLGKNLINNQFLNRLLEIEPSLSMFILYLELDKEIKFLPKEGTNTWFLPSYNIEMMYMSAKNRSRDNLSEFMLHTFSGRSMSVFINAQFEHKKYWDKHKDEICNKLIDAIGKIIPQIKKHIVYKGIADPYTLYKMTLNYRGAAYGWSKTPFQFAEPGLSQITPINNLYLSSQWSTLVQGIGGVAYLAADTARMILRKENLIK